METQDHSAKNIPIPGKMEYMKQLVFSIEKLINRMRFAKSAFDRKHSADPKVRNNPPQHRETYGFKTNKQPIRTRIYKSLKKSC